MLVAVTGIPHRILCVDCYKKQTNWTKQTEEIKFIEDEQKLYVYYIEMDKIKKKNENHGNPKQRNQRQNQERKRKVLMTNFKHNLLEIII